MRNARHLQPRPGRQGDAPLTSIAVAHAARYAAPVAAKPSGSDRQPATQPVANGDVLFPPHQPYPPTRDPVDEASQESFPASDAPSTWSREE
jgi:hypothetical protein